MKNYLECIKLDKYTTLKNEKRFNLLQIEHLSVNPITLDHSLWVNVGQTFLNLFIVSKRGMVCSESSIVRCDVCFFVQDSTVLFQWSVTALLQYRLGETFTAKFEFIRGNVIATVCLTSQTYYLRTSKLFFVEAGLSHIILFMFYTTCSEEEICYSISSETIETVN